MNEFKISSNLQENYAEYYEGEQETEWRTIGAVEKARHIQLMCRDLEISSVVEIGAGDGAILERLSQLGFGGALHALEISQSGVEKIETRGISALTKCSLFDGYSVPYGDQELDLAFLSHVVEHVEFPRKLLYEAQRVAKYIFVEVPLEDNYRLGSNFVLDKVGHINFYNPKTFRHLIQSCGMDILEQKTFNASKESYMFKQGNKGRFNFAIKQGLLGISETFATSMFTYNGAILCKKSAA